MDNFDGYIADLYRQIEIELISSMKRNLALHLAEEQLTGIKYPQWQAVKLKELKRFQRENARIIGRKTKGLSKEVSEHMQSELKEGSSHEFKVYRDALGKGYKSAKKVKDSFFKVDDEKIKGMINALNNDFTIANNAMFRMVNDTYRQVIYKYSLFMANGAYTYKKAYDAAVKDFLERGINCIEYKDGRRVNIADYCRMAVRTASQRAYMTGQGEVRKRIGNPLIIITKHNTSCKLCKPFERKVLIDDVYSGGTKADGEYMLLSEAMEKGLYHPNCRHGSDTYYREREEFFEEYYKTHPENNSADDEGEENSIAHIENVIQKYRRLSGGSIDEENISKYQILLDEWQDKKAEIVDKTGESGIINIEIDEFVPCLRDSKTGELLETEVTELSKNQLKKYNVASNWNDDWSNRPNDEHVFGVFLKNDTMPQGLISLRYDEGGTYVASASTAPWNNKLLVGKNQKYIGVGGHLFAVAVEESLKHGGYGTVYGFATNSKVLEHYKKEFGAIHFPIHHEYQFIIEGTASENLLNIYNYERR